VLGWLFFAFLGIAVVLIGIGYLTDVVISDMLGTIIVFLLGLALLTTGLTVKTGEVEAYMYGNNFTGYHWDYDTGTAPDGPQTDAYLFHRNITDTYGTYDAEASHTMGWLLLVFGILGFVLSMFRL